MKSCGLLVGFALSAALAPPTRLEYRLKPEDTRAWNFTWREVETIAPANGPVQQNDLELSGTLAQRVLAVNADGTIVLSIEVRSLRLRVTVNGEAAPPAEPGAQRSLVLIDRRGKVLESRRETPGPINAATRSLESLLTMALPQFPDRDLMAGDEWEVAAPGAPKLRMKLTDLEERNGRQVARLSTQAELPMRLGQARNAPRAAHMAGRFTIESAQTVEVDTGWTIGVSGSTLMNLEITNGGAPAGRRSTRVTLMLSPANVSSSTPTLPVVPRAVAPAKSASPANPPAKLKDGEIKLNGIIAKIADASELIVRVESFVNAQGRTAIVSPPRTKTIRLDDKTVVYQKEVRGKVSRGALTEGIKLSIIGKERGGGKPFAATRIDIETPPVVPPFNEAPGERK